MFNVHLGLILIIFAVKLIGIVSTLVIFVLRMEYSLQKSEVAENYWLFAVEFNVLLSHPVTHFETLRTATRTSGASR